MCFTHFYDSLESLYQRVLFRVYSSDEFIGINNNNKPICNAPDASVTDPEARRS